MANSFPLRPITPDELPDFLGVFGHAFYSTPATPSRLARMRTRFEFERSLAAFDGTAMVGTAGIHSFSMRVPGAQIPVAGVTMVSVLPTHRRQGIASAFMRRQLDDIYARGEAVAALWASEAGIYRRFGYGCASWIASYMVRYREGALAAPGPADDSLRLRLAEPSQVREELTRVYDQVLAQRPGFFARDDGWWDRILDDPPEDRGTATPLRCVLASDADGPRGYGLFRGQSRWTDGMPDSSLDVVEAITASPAATAAIWGDLLNRDLTAEVVTHICPVDDPLLHLLADSRRLRASVKDGVWVRLVDVGSALSQRRYACPADVVIEVTDDWCRHNEGRWRLAAGKPGQAGEPGFEATCERTTASPDIAVPAHVLGSTYLGGTRLGSLAAAGLVTEFTPGAVAALSAALSWDPAPWCPVIF